MKGGTVKTTTYLTRARVMAQHKAAEQAGQRRAAKHRQAWLDAVAAVEDPVARLRLARAELEAAELAMRRLRNQAAGASFAVVGGHAGGGWAEVARRVGLSRPEVIRLAELGDWEQTA